MTVRIKLTELMEERGVTQIDLVRELKLSPTTIGKLYRQKSTRLDLETIDKICNFFEVPIDGLLEVENEHKHRKTKN